MKSLTYEEILHRRQEGNVFPVVRAVVADLLTPVSAFLRVANDRPYAFLLESVAGGEQVARYSFIGCDPYVIVRSRTTGVEFDYGTRVETVSGNVMEALKTYLDRVRSVNVPDLPPFTGGGVGYFAYDMVRLFEAVPEAARDDLELDDAVMMFCSTLLAFDHVKHQIVIVANLFVEPGDDERAIKEKYDATQAELDRLAALLNRTLVVESPCAVTATDPLSPHMTSNMTAEAYRAAVHRAKEYIAAGDIFQVVLSQRFETDMPMDPFDVYRALRVLNPSPYLFFLRLNSVSVVGSSPEMLVRVSGRSLYYRPIAGTRRRGRTAAEDQRLEAELRQDAKECAEHIMLVDLGRNDLGRVAEIGSIKVTELMRVERYSHVMHLVSGIEATLSDGRDRFDALAACFPAGTVTGAPKVRAMEIISELEPTRRGLYAGAIGYLDFSGNLDSCITLRTLVFKDGKAYIQVGAGIVADSQPETEYQETVVKAMAMLEAIGWSAQRLTQAVDDQPSTISPGSGG